MNKKFKVGDKVQINFNKFLTHRKFVEVMDALDRYNYETTHVFIVGDAHLPDKYTENYILFHDRNGTRNPKILRAKDSLHRILTFRAAELRLASDNAPNNKKLALINWIGDELHE